MSELTRSLALHDYGSVKVHPVTEPPTGTLTRVFAHLGWPLDWTLVGRPNTGGDAGADFVEGPVGADDEPIPSALDRSFSVHALGQGQRSVARR